MSDWGFTEADALILAAMANMPDDLLDDFLESMRRAFIRWLQSQNIPATLRLDKPLLVSYVKQWAKWYAEQEPTTPEKYVLCLSAIACFVDQLPLPDRKLM